MIIDTLILSGGGPSGIAYLGIFKALFEEKILDNKLTGIKEIITTSVGIIPSIFFMLGISIDVAGKVIINYNFKNMINTDNISINDILLDYGLFTTDGVYNLIHSLFKNYHQRDDFTLKEFYELTKIKLNVKVFNVTLKQIQYLSYENEPELSLLTLSQMTTAIPLFFKPVVYKGHSYIDGGLRGHFPIEKCESDNYLGVFISGGSINSDSEILKLFPLLEFIYSLMINQDQIIYDIKNNRKNKRILFNEVDYGLNFDMPLEDKLDIINDSYKLTLEHIRQHLVKDTV